MAKTWQQNVAQELIKIIINYVAELGLYNIIFIRLKIREEIYGIYFFNTRLEVI